MKTKIFSFCLFFFILNGNSHADSLENWLNSFGFSKPVVQNESFYFGISYDGKPSKLEENLNILLDSLYEENIKGKYFVREGCKPHDCGNKGFLWIDSEEKVAIGVILHHSWEKLDFDNYIEDQIFIFSNFFKETTEFPEDFINYYLDWINRGGVNPDHYIAKKIKPSVYRFLNSESHLKKITNIK